MCVSVYSQFLFARDGLGCVGYKISGNDREGGGGQVAELCAQDDQLLQTSDFVLQQPDRWTGIRCHVSNDVGGDG